MNENPSADRAQRPGPGSSPASPLSEESARRILLETARQLAGSLEPAAIFARMRDSVCASMACDGMIVSSYDATEALIRCQFAWVGGNELDPESLPPLQYREDSGGMQSQVIRTGRPMLFADVAERVQDPRGTYYEVEAGGRVRDLQDSGPPRSRSAIMVPLLLEGAVVGVVQVMADRENAYGSAELDLLEGIALLLAVALENARLFQRLQAELEERRRAERVLRQAQEALRDADRRKDEFLATLGHELRNPLNPIRSAVEMLRRRGAESEEARWSHEVIQRQVRHLSRLIDDLLDVSRITQGRLELRRAPVWIDDVLDGAAEQVRPLATESGHRLELERATRPLRVDADPVRLSQVFSNLFDNAVKYSQPGGVVRIRTEERGNFAVVTVQDEGRGIPSEHLPHVFDLFYQADRSLGRPHEGLGIGLTLVKRIVELHGGAIEAESEGPGRGSRFSVRLPLVRDEVDSATPPGAPASAASGVAAPTPRLATARAPASLPPAEASAASGGWRFLIADDNQDSADSMAILLRMSGHDVQVAYDGEEALRIAETFGPQIALLDIGMPRLNGHEVAQALRGRPGGRELILIAATGWGQEEDRRRSLETGFDAHLVKPVDHEALLRLVAELVPLR